MSARSDEAPVVLRVRDLKKVYGEGDDAVEAIGSVSFEAARNELICVVGPSGCGKTTLLRCMSGLMSPTSGEVEVLGEPVTEPPADLGLVFQDYSRSLFPWMRVAQNVEFTLKRLPIDKAERKRRVSDALDAVGLAGFDRKYPWQLSGGMQQRVAIARALAFQPKVLLMDEPFASVDAQTRSELEDLVLRLRHAYDVTIVFVTHDIDESVYLADRVVILSSRPTRVREALAVDLPRPRDQISTKELPEFAHLRAHVFESIMTSARPGTPIGADRD